MGGPGSGVPRKPTALRGIDGGKLPPKNLPAEPKPDGKIVRPAGMTPHARKVWDRLAAKLEKSGVLTFWDVEAFRLYCEAISRSADAQADVNEHGLIIKGKTGSVANPAVRLLRDANDEAMRLARHFGLTPASRAALVVAKPEPQGKELDRFLDDG